MLNGPLISVVIPFFNTEKKILEDAIDSVKKQSYSNYEIILVDDGSDDSYADGINDVVNELDNARLIRTENKGASVARNTGVMNAKGDYITFLDADDVLMPVFLEHACKIISENNADIVIGGVKQFVNRDDIKVQGLESMHEVETINYSGKNRQYLIAKLVDCEIPIRISDNSYISRGPVSRLIKKDLVKKHLFDPDLKICEDMAWNIELIQNCDKVYVAKEQWYCYWMNPSSLTHKYNPEMFKMWHLFLQKVSQMLDLKRDEYFVAFGNRVYDGLYQVWKNQIQKKETSKEERKRFEYVVTHNQPWTILRDERFIKLSEKKMKFFCFLYKKRLLFFFLSLRNLLKI